MDLSVTFTLLVRLFAVSVALNYPWEIGQAFLYVGMDYSLATGWHCFVASLGDGLLVWIIHLVGWLSLGHRDWFVRRGRYAVMLPTGVAIAIAVEWIALHWLARWSYTAQMPLVPGLDIGWVPVLQMVLLPPLIFALVARWVATASDRRTGAPP